jgi:hypothetical protein
MGIKLIAGKERPVLVRGIGEETIVVGFEAVEVETTIQKLRANKVLAELIKSGELKEYKEASKPKDEKDGK